MSKTAKRSLIIIVIIASLAATGFLVWAFRATVTNSMPLPEFNLYDRGTERVVSYEKYGKFIDEGKPEYKYVIKKRSQLAAAAGEGVYPNTSVYRDPIYKTLLREGKLEGTHWDYLDNPGSETAFYKWATANEDPGVKQFYTALALENAGLVTQAIKAYYAVLVHFPKTVSFTYWNTPWYPAKVAIDKIHYLTVKYPFLGMKLIGAEIMIENGFNLDHADDITYVKAGRMVKCKPTDLVAKQEKRRLGAVTRQIGYGNVNLLRYSSGDWQLMVGDKPFIIKGVAYAPTKIGESPDEGTLTDWMKADYDSSGRIDGPYEAWVDENKNERKDEGEITAGDFKLMKDMGVNTVRIYDHKLTSNKELLRELYKKYGIMIMMGD